MNKKYIAPKINIINVIATKVIAESIPAGTSGEHSHTGNAKLADFSLFDDDEEIFEDLEEF